MTQTVRCFVACDLSLGLLDELSKCQRALRDAIGDHARVRWVSPATMHVTLKFLGDKVDPASVQALRDELSRVARRQPPFAIELAGLGAFPSPDRPRVLWTALMGDVDLLTSLAEAVEGCAAEMGFKPDRHGFSPHVTLGRLRRSPEQIDLSEQLAEFEGRAIGNCRVKEVVLYRSILSPKGAHYEALLRAPLTGRRPTPPKRTEDTAAEEQPELAADDPPVAEASADGAPIDEAPTTKEQSTKARPADEQLEHAQTTDEETESDG